MREEDLENRYFHWMCRLVCPKRSRRSYHELLMLLNDIEFVYSLPMDGNCYEHGVDLRYRFAADEHINQRWIANSIDQKPCSVLEMMVALAVRIEEHIMSNDELGDRTGAWFWGMVRSLKLDGMDDEHMNEQIARFLVDGFLERRYAPNGEGGLFTLRHCRRDLRNVEIWWQAMWYLGEYIKEEQE